MISTEIDRVLATMTVIVDTREQDTTSSEKRYKAFGAPWRREKIDYGDYSATFSLPGGGTLDLRDRVVIERKMSLDELSACFAQQRRRFVAEFERAKAAGAKVYLLVEKGSWESVYAGAYGTRFSPAAYIASLTSWLARYQCVLIFCQPQTSGKLIAEILRREAREILLNEKEGEEEGQ